MDFLKRALNLARRALGNTSPNPAVGAVLVKEGRIVGEGFTQPPGQDHAEVVALKQAGEAARGATLYTTLEPCCYFGRTPPCTSALIAAGVAEVHMAMLDPNPLICGRGRAQLEAAGIRTYVGEREEEARALVEAHTKFITTGQPLVIAKFAMSLDGKIATRSGDSRWVTGEKARRYANALRRQVDAVMVGVNTLLRDDPQLTARDRKGRPWSKQPLRVIVDSRGRTDPGLRIFRQPGKTLLAVACPEESRLLQLSQAGAEVVFCPSQDNRVDLTTLMKLLGQREITSILVEGGGTLLGSLFDVDLVDKVVAFIAPVILGGREAPSPVEGHGVERMAEALRLQKVQVRRLGPDLMLLGYRRLL